MLVGYKRSIAQSAQKQVGYDGAIQPIQFFG